jgi:hypothetical protein
MKSFQPYADRAASRLYYEVPAAVIEDPERLGAWVERRDSCGKRPTGHWTTTEEVGALSCCH